MPSIAIDFDGVISHYTGWKGGLTLPAPVVGCVESIQKLKKEGWEIIIFTARSDISSIKKYLEDNEIPFDYINYNPKNESDCTNMQKVIADVYLDDKAVRFNGDWEYSLKEIERAYKKEWWRH